VLKRFNFTGPQIAALAVQFVSTQTEAVISACALRARRA
jgi:hypothetical protein